MTVGTAAEYFRLATFTIMIVATGCSYTAGSETSIDQLGYKPCEAYFDCGPGRFCNSDGYCTTECRSNADCRQYCASGRCNRTGEPCQSDSDCPQDEICNVYGQCLAQGEPEQCSSHADCGEGRWCNGTCSSSKALCGSVEDCPWGERERCEGLCSQPCGSDNDCLSSERELTCTPVGQCLQTGWEEWIPPAELPPTSCRSDDQCKALGWRYYCGCEKSLDQRTGRYFCKGGSSSVCVESDEPLDFGSGPEDSPAHAFRGVWGMRMEIAVVTAGLPLVGSQNTYSSNLMLVKIDHAEGNRLVLHEKLCKIDLINFVDSDEPFNDLAWMLVPARYLDSLPLLEQTVEVASAEPGAPFATSQSVEVRGCILENPSTDPLPTRHDYEANPNDPRFWDQDGDGHVGMTTLMNGVLQGAIYNVQRWKAVYRGEIIDPDHIRGLSEVENEQLVISASNESLNQDTTTEIHPQADRTYFRLMRLSDDASCKTLIREAERNDSWLRHTPHLMDVPDP